MMEGRTRTGAAIQQLPYAGGVAGAGHGDAGLGADPGNVAVLLPAGFSGD